MRYQRLLVLSWAMSAGGWSAEQINHAGRILEAVPAVTTPLSFNSAAADAVVSQMQILPRDNPWNEDISLRPVQANSAAIIARVRADLVAINSNRATVQVFAEMNYVLVPPAQPLRNLMVSDYPDESDLNGGTTPIARYPIPDNLPIEGWPSARGSETLAHAQATDDGGDRHAIMVDPAAQQIFETWRTVLTTATPAWTCAEGAIFPLNSNALRPDGWTSADAAGLPMFPALIRYDECQRGEIEHALRLVCNKTRREYIYPATHFASSIATSNPHFADYPAMGQRFRLKASFTIPSTWTNESKCVAAALKKYGGLMADNGGFFSTSACPDDRFPRGCFDALSTIDVNQFEVVVATGPGEGPRSAGVPTVNAGSDKTATVAAGAALLGTATGSGLTFTWSFYPTPAAVGIATFTTANALSTNVQFTTAGVYTLRLKATDGVHTPVYDLVVVTVSGSGGSDTTPPVLTALSATNLTTTTATVTWTSNEATDAQIEYGLTTAYGMHLGDGIIGGLTHQLTLSGLQAGTTYHWRVISHDAAGNLTYSADQTFITLAVSSSTTGGSTTDGGTTGGNTAGGGTDDAGNGGGSSGCGFGALAAMACVSLILLRWSSNDRYMNE